MLTKIATARPHLWSRRIVSMLAAVVLVVLGNVVFTAPAAVAAEITIADANLRAEIEDALGIGPGDPITEAEALTLTTLDVTHKAIQSLAGLEKFTALTSLKFNKNQVVDLSPLSSLTDLTKLEFFENRVNDLTPIEPLTNLTYLNFGLNQVSSLLPLETLTQLTDLLVYRNLVNDLSGVEPLINLRYLHLGGNTVSDLSPLETLTELRDLELWRNGLSNLSGLEHLTKLTRLQLSNNQITDITPLAGLLTNLAYLTLEGQEVGLGDGQVNEPVANPVKDAAGNKIPVTSSAPGFTLAAGADAWSFDTPGNLVEIEWQSELTLNSNRKSEFSGKIVQTITEPVADPVAITSPADGHAYTFPYEGAGAAVTVEGTGHTGAELSYYIYDLDNNRAIYARGSGHEIEDGAWSIDFSDIPEGNYEAYVWQTRGNEKVDDAISFSVAKEQATTTEEPVVEAPTPDPATATLIVTVVDAAGNPVSDADVRLCDAFGDCFDHGITNADGIATKTDLTFEAFGIHVYVAGNTGEPDAYKFVELVDPVTEVTLEVNVGEVAPPPGDTETPKDKDAPNATDTLPTSEDGELVATGADIGLVGLAAALVMMGLAAVVLSTRRQRQH